MGKWGRGAGLVARVVGAIAVVMALLGAGPVGAQEAPASDELPAVVDPEGLLTQADVWAVTDAVTGARTSSGVDIVLLYVGDLAGRTALDHAVEKAPATTDDPRLTLVVAAAPRLTVELLTSPRDAAVEAFDVGQRAADATQAEADANPDLGLVFASLVFADRVTRDDELSRSGPDLSGAQSVVVVYFALWAALAVVFLALRLVAIPMRPITLADVGPHQAYGLVDDLLYGMAEGRFGFPSGVFLSTYDKSEPGRTLVHDEYVPTGTVLGRVSAWAMKVSTHLPGLGFLIAWAVLACFWLYAGLWMWLAEQISKRLLQSRVRTRIEPTPDGRGSVLRVRTRGPCAHLLRRHVRAAFATPELPSRYRSLVPRRTPEPEPTS